MYDANYFLNILKKQIADEGGDALVTISQRSVGSIYVRNVVKSLPGYVLLNVWIDESGKPIPSPSSNSYSREIPYGYHAVSVSYESISHVNIMAV